MLYENESTGMGYIAYHDKKEFFKLSWQFIKTSWHLIRNYRSIKSSYDVKLPEMTSKQFWERKLLDEE